jgi:hypothetical protein
MPKKTKKEKIRALQHRVQTIPHDAPSSYPPAHTQPVSQLGYSYAFQAKTHTPKSETTTVDTAELHAITLDLKKTLFLAVIAVAAELLLYWQLVIKK